MGRLKASPLILPARVVDVHFYAVVVVTSSHSVRENSVTEGLAKGMGNQDSMKEGSKKERKS
jgi:hypothetical protein